MKKLMGGRRDLELIFAAIVVMAVTVIVLAAIVGAGSTKELGVAGGLLVLVGALAGAARGSNAQPPADPPAPSDPPA